MSILQKRRHKVLRLYSQAQNDNQFHKTAQARHILTLIAERENQLQELQTKFFRLWQN